MIERDCARRGYEITLFRRMWFLSDEKIESSRLLAPIFHGIISRWINVREKIWRRLHRKELESLKKENEKIEWIQINEFVKMRKPE